MSCQSAVKLMNCRLMAHMWWIMIILFTCTDWKMAEESWPPVWLPICLDRDFMLSGKSLGSLFLQTNKKWGHTVIRRDILHSRHWTTICLYILSICCGKFCCFVRLTYIHPMANVEEATRAMVGTMQQLQGNQITSLRLSLSCSHLGGAILLS